MELLFCVLENLENQIKHIQQEKNKLLERHDETTKQITLKEKLISTLESEKETMETNLREQEEIIDNLDSELSEVQNQNLEIKEQLKQREDEVMGLRMEMDKDFALIQQEKDHLEEKVKNLEQQIIDMTEEYEERASAMKDKIKNLKKMRIRDNMADKENNSKFGNLNMPPEELLENILNVKIASIPEFCYIKILNSTSSHSDKTKGSKANWELEDDVYEIEVVDNVIYRESYQILGLFHRLQSQYKSHTFPENLHELLYQRDFCSPDMRRMTLQHHLNELTKQEVFRKSRELIAFLGIPNGSS